MFGGAQQNQQQKPMFGGFGQQPFGTGTSATTGGIFGTAGFGTAGGQTLFGGQQQAKPALNFGGAPGTFLFDNLLIQIATIVILGFGTTNLGFGGTGVTGMMDPSQNISLGT